MGIMATRTYRESLSWLKKGRNDVVEFVYLSRSEFLLKLYLVM